MKALLPTLILLGLFSLLTTSNTAPYQNIYLKLDDTGEIVKISPDNNPLLDCLCRCYQVGQFSCGYDTEDRGHSPSCRNLDNGPCICKAYGCFRRPLPTDGDCYRACNAEYGDGVSTSSEGPVESLGELLDIYEQNKSQFSHCQDLAYAAIFGKAPGQAQVDKGEIPRGLSKYQYSLVENGYIPAAQTEVNIDLRDGDILMLDFNRAPAEGNAAHYAVVLEGKIYQILHFREGGEIIPLGDIAYFFKKRVITKPNREVLRPSNIYQYYKIYRR